MSESRARPHATRAVVASEDPVERSFHIHRSAFYTPPALSVESASIFDRGGVFFRVRPMFKVPFGVEYITFQDHLHLFITNIVC